MKLTPDEAEAKAQRLEGTDPQGPAREAHSRKAEAEATRLGLSPLATCPDANQFDPMGELQWSLPMAVAWIVWRSPDGVREHWDAYRQECLDWQGGEWREGFDGPVHKGYFLEQRRPATLVRLYLSESFRAEDESAPKPMMSVEDAQRAL